MTAPPPTPPRGRPARALAIAAVVLALLAAGAGAWLFATPWLAVAALQDAAGRGDAAAIEAGVDFPALRASLTQQAAERARAATGSNGALGALAAGVAEAVAQAAVDRVVRPEVVAAMLHGRAPEAGSPRAAGSAVAPSMAYDGRDDFVVTFPDAAGAGRPLALRFHRSGLATWRLVAAKIP